MSAIVNERDKLLQAAGSRLVTVDLGSNINVPAIKGLKIDAASLIFQVNQAGMPNPASILLTANLTQITGTVTWAVVSGTASGIAGTGATKTLNYASMSTDVVTISASVTDGGITYVAYITIAKVRDGQNGAGGSDATAYWLIASPSIVTKKSDGSLTPTTITFTLMKATGTSGPTAATNAFFYFYISSDGGATYFIHSAPGPVASATFTPFNTLTHVKCVGYVSGSGALDELVVPLVNEGTNGITPVLTNSAHTVPASAAGVVSSYVGSGTSFQIYEGSTALMYVNSTGSLAAGRFTIGTATVSPSGKITAPTSYAGHGTTVASTADHSGMDSATDSVTITYPITVRRGDGTDTNFNLVQTITKAKVGAGGTRGSLAMIATGSSWSDATADATVLSVTGSATKIFGDSVTISNGSTFAETRRWNSAAWVNPGQVISGNMFVDGTLSTAALVVGAVSVAATGDTSQDTTSFANTVPSALTQTNGITLTTTGAPVKYAGSVLVSGRSWNASALYVRVFANLYIDGSPVGVPFSAVVPVIAFSGVILSQAQNFFDFQVTVPMEYRAVLSAGSHTFKASVTCELYTAGPNTSGVAWGTPPAGQNNFVSVRVGSFAEENKV